MFGQVIASRTSSGPRPAPEFSSPGALGTQLGICTNMLMGSCAASSCINRTPARLAHLVGPEAGAGIFQPRRARHAARHLHEHVDGELRGFVVH